MLISYRTFSDHHEIEQKRNKNKTFKIYFIYLFILFFSCAGPSLQFMGFSLQWLLLLRITGSRHLGFSGCGTQAQYLQLGSRVGSVVVVHGLYYSGACGIFMDQGSNPCPLHCQVDSYPLYHQRSPR